MRDDDYYCYLDIYCYFGILMPSERHAVSGEPARQIEGEVFGERMRTPRAARGERCVRYEYSVEGERVLG
jgi:hypothetical protein